MATNIVVTNAGRAALVNAENTGTDPVTITQVGLSETAVVAAKTDTALAGEFKRLAGVGGTVVSPDTIHIAAIDESADAYSLRSLALYLGDGTLFGIYGQAAAILEKAAASSTALSFDIIFADIDAALLSFGDTDFLLPQATTDTRGTVELATVAEAQAGIDALRALTPANAKAAILGWLLSQDGAGSGLDADLLDGQQGSYYANIPARLGFTPANKAGETFTGDMVFDGGGAFGPRVNAAAGQYALQRFSRGNSARWDLGMDNGAETGANAGSNFFLHAFADNGAYLFPALYARRSDGMVSSRGHLLWNAGNDGAGSGLDADLLDGQHGSYYSNVPARLGFTPANKAGDTFTGPVTVTNGGSSAALLLNGDVRASRGNGEGAVYLGGSERYLWYDGGNYNLAGANLYVIGGLAWTAGNDGAGSGLDADLLDGQQGSYYSNVPARLGYTPANRNGDTFTGPLWTTQGGIIGILSGGGNGGVQLNYGGSGRTGYTAYHLPNGTRAGYTGFAPDGGAIQYVNEVAAGHQFVGGQISCDGNLVWSAGNDGAGSGLDADSVDGWHAHDLAKYGDFGRNLTPAGGHQDLPGGLRLQWGSVYVGSGNAGVDLPAPFPNTCVFAGVAGGSGSTTQDNAPVVIAWNKDNITIRNAQSVGLNVAFFAIGW